VADPAQLQSILRAGAEKARARSGPFMQRLRHAVGLRNLADQPQASKAKAGKASLPSFKQYREADGKHYFKLVDAAGALLLQSTAFDAPQDAGRAVARLKQQGWPAGAEGAAQLAAGIDEPTVRAALAQLAA
jgi:tryptophanyl-tRNA synthetase